MIEATDNDTSNNSNSKMNKNSRNLLDARMVHKTSWRHAEVAILERLLKFWGLSWRSGWYLTPLLTYFFLCVLCCGDHTSKWEGWFHTIPSAEKRNPEKTKPTFLFCFPFFPSISLVLLVTTKTNKGVTPWTMLCLSVTMRTCQAMRWGDEHSEGKLMKKIIKE